MDDHPWMSARPSVRPNVRPHCDGHLTVGGVEARTLIPSVNEPHMSRASKRTYVRLDDAAAERTYVETAFSDDHTSRRRFLMNVRRSSRGRNSAARFGRREVEDS